MIRRFFTAALPVAALCVVTALSAPAYAQTPTNLYELNGNLNDSLGGPALTSNGATQDPNGLFFGVNQGPSLSGASALSGGTYSIELYFRFDTTTGYRRIVDFKNRTSDTGLYNLNTSLNFYNLTTGPAGVINDNTPVHVIITRNSTDSSFVGYVNGVQQISFIDSSNLATFSGPNNIAYFFVDDAAVANEASAGAVDYIRIYNTALTQTQVTNRYNNRGTFFVSNAAAPEPSTLVLLAPALPLAGLAFRRRKMRD